MITQIILNFLRDVVVGLLEIVNPSLETEAAGLGGALDSFFNAMGGGLALIDPFIPAASVAGALGLLASVCGFLMLVWLGRFLVSIATGGGGSV